jgi:hypothetical protein
VRYGYADAISDIRAFAARAGMPIQGPWKPILDVVSAEETNQGLPDITFLLLNRHTRYPMQISPVRSNDPTPEQRERARREVQKIIDRYNPGAPNPFLIAIRWLREIWRLPPA